jgi:hypothetical protein
VTGNVSARRTRSTVNSAAAAATAAASVSSRNICECELIVQK